MALPLFILLEGLLYVVCFGGLSLFRREGLSIQFAVEAIAIAIIAAGLAAFTPFAINPIWVLAIIYLVTQRVRLLVDLGTLFARRGNFVRAEQMYNLALRLWPDHTGRLIVEVNQGTARLQQGAVDEAITTLKSVLDKASLGYLGLKYEAAAHYNLGVAYRRKQMETQATLEFNAVLDTWPASIYARRAEMALEKSHHKNKPPTSGGDTPNL